jgi:flagellar basal-body rod protein FlgB
MQITTALSDELAKYLDLSGLELKLTAQNMANLDTPGYRTVGFDFSEEMQRSITESLSERERENKAGRDSDCRPTAVKVGLVDGLIERPDGNNVSMDREGMKMAEAQLQFRTGVELLKSEFTEELDAIHADSK